MKLNSNYQSLKFILNRILKDDPYIDQINLADAAEWTGEAINLLGINDLYGTFPCKVTISDYRGKLPANYKSIKSVRDTDNLLQMKETINRYPKGINPNTLYENYEDFSIKGQYIYTDFKEGELEIIFEGYVLDDDGFPMIPDEDKMLRYIQWFIAEKCYYKKWALGKVPDKVWAYVQQEKAWATSAARSFGKLPSKQKMESIKDMWLRLVPDTNALKDSFVSLNTIEEIKIR